eukprot:TRINITY_DN45819_c0_g1_i1.p1 TRINITY_DN45819_c0_g1~~TRINITY_DN45819_c0_g1_i1.p1  ORF type:complete len:417 (+),score=64.02 TRINITY_DN45819_c0_g1_i1:81-1331(+)
MDVHLKNRAHGKAKKWVQVEKKEVISVSVAPESQHGSCVYTRDLMLHAREKCMTADVAFKRKTSTVSTEATESTELGSDDDNLSDLLPFTRSSTLEEDWSGSSRDRRRAHSKLSGGGAAKVVGTEGRSRTMSDVQWEKRASVDAGTTWGQRTRAVSWQEGVADSVSFVPYAIAVPFFIPSNQCSVLPVPAHGVCGSGEQPTGKNDFDDAVNTKQTAAILTQAEYYFSVPNIGHDTFLRSLMDERGWVLIERLVQFPKLRQMKVEAEDVSAALKTSTYLVVSRDGRRVRIKKATLRDAFPRANLVASPGVFAMPYNPDVTPIIGLSESTKYLADDVNSVIARASLPADIPQSEATAIVTMGSNRSPCFNRGKHALHGKVHLDPNHAAHSGTRVTHAGRVGRMRKVRKTHVKIYHKRG